jgi:ribonuclease P protein component
MSPGSERPADAPLQGDCRTFCTGAKLGPRQRLRRTAQFQIAYDQNRRWHGRHMVLFRLTLPDSSLRLGVVASKKVGNAVERARAKRRLREAFRRHRHLFTAGRDDLVLVARRSILTAQWPAVVAELLKLADQAGLIPPAAR